MKAKSIIKSLFLLFTILIPCFLSTYVVLASEIEENSFSPAMQEQYIQEANLVYNELIKYDSATGKFVVN